MTVTISAALKAHYQKPQAARRMICRFTQKDSTVIGFTDFDLPLVVGGVTYNPAYSRSDVSGAADLSVDNLEYVGGLDSPQITVEDLRLGKWDNARFVIAELNPYDLTMGTRIVRAGWLGEVSTERVNFSAELNGLTKAYSTTIGKLTGAACRHDLYDAGCTINPTLFTVTGTIEDVGADGVTLYDSTRTEPGPTGSIDIVNITNANPGVVTLLTVPSPALTQMQLVIISEVGGMIEVNQQTQVHNPSGDTFELSIDTSGFGAYTSGGIVTPLGASSGYFDYGKITWLTGDNATFEMEIARYVPGILVLALPMPFPVQAGDTYSLTAGCDKFLPTCRDKFNGNVVNYDGEWYLTGNDKLLEIGKGPGR